MLTVNFKKKLGELTEMIRGEKYTFPIYACNGLCAWVYEYEEDGKEMVQLQGFFVDEQHAKNCFGIGTTGKQNIYEGDIVKVKLNSADKGMRKLAALMVKSFNSITIELYMEESAK